MAVTPRSSLRDLTRAEHGAVDRLFSRFDLSHVSSYRSFLRAQASAHLAIELMLDAAGAASLIDDWPERRRAALLQADLAELGAAIPRRAAPPPLRSDAEVLGGAYVLEGSRLGGAVLSSRVAAGAPVRFLSAQARPGSWRRLQALLDARLGKPAELHAAVGAARACFRCYEQAASLELEPIIA